MAREAHQEEEEEQRRFNQCIRKYEKIVKQFDELVEIMAARTKPPRRRQKGSSNQTASCTTSSIQADNDVLVQTVTRFLHELKAEP